MHLWKIIYYENDKKESEVYQYIEQLKENEQAKLFSWLKVLEEKGPNLPRPYADLLEDGIHELRIKITGTQIRILYFFCYKDYIVLTHAFQKSTDKIPKKEINKAKKYKEDFLNRYTIKDLEELIK